MRIKRQETAKSGETSEVKTVEEGTSRKNAKGGRSRGLDRNKSTSTAGAVKSLPCQEERACNKPEDVYKWKERGHWTKTRCFLSFLIRQRLIVGYYCDILVILFVYFIHYLFTIATVYSVLVKAASKSGPTDMLS